MRNSFPCPYTLENAKWYVNDCLENDGNNRIIRAIETDGKVVGNICIFLLEDIYGTHEPTIEQNRWNTLQKILDGRPPVIGGSSSGYDNIFRGVIKCADCGSAMLTKVEQKRKRNSAHTIEARTVHEVVLADIQKHAGQALTDRKAMVTDIAERLNLQMSADREQQKKELRQCKQRVSEIENLYAKLYEDLTRELLTEKRFQMLSARYDSEQEEQNSVLR